MDSRIDSVVISDNEDEDGPSWTRGEHLEGLKAKVGDLKLAEEGFRTRLHGKWEELRDIDREGGSTSSRDGSRVVSHRETAEVRRRVLKAEEDGLLEELGRIRSELKKLETKIEGLESRKRKAPPAVQRSPSPHKRPVVLVPPTPASVSPDKGKRRAQQQTTPPATPSSRSMHIIRPSPSLSASIGYKPVALTARLEPDTSGTALESTGEAVVDAVGPPSEEDRSREETPKQEPAALRQGGHRRGAVQPQPTPTPALTTPRSRPSRRAKEARKQYEDPESDEESDEDEYVDEAPLMSRRRPVTATPSSSRSARGGDGSTRKSAANQKGKASEARANGPRTGTTQASGSHDIDDESSEGNSRGGLTASGKKKASQKTISAETRTAIEGGIEIIGSGVPSATHVPFHQLQWVGDRPPTARVPVPLTLPLQRTSSIDMSAFGLGEGPPIPDHPQVFFRRADHKRNGVVKDRGITGAFNINNVKSFEPLRPGDMEFSKQYRSEQSGEGVVAWFCGVNREFQPNLPSNPGEPALILSRHPTKMWSDKTPNSPPNLFELFVKPVVSSKSKGAPGWQYFGQYQTAAWQDGVPAELMQNFHPAIQQDWIKALHSDPLFAEMEATNDTTSKGKLLTRLMEKGAEGRQLHVMRCVGFNLALFQALREFGVEVKP